MIFSKSRDEYNKYYSDLQNLQLTSIINYFDVNWNTCVTKWTLFGRNMNNYLLNTTSNRVESLNQKIKLVVTKYSSIIRFFKDLSLTINVRSSEGDIVMIKNKMKKSRTQKNNVVLMEYKKILTNFAFIKVSEEYFKFTISNSIRRESLKSCIHAPVVLHALFNATSVTSYQE